MTTNAIIPATPDTMRTALRELAAATSDAVANTARLFATARHAYKPTQPGDAVALNTDGLFPKRMLLFDDAHVHLANALGIPTPYYRRLLASNPSLLAENINHWLSAEPARRLFRLQAPHTEALQARALSSNADSFVRAVLSDRYRCLDSLALFDAVWPAIEAAGGRLASYHLGNRRFHFRAVLEQRDVSEFLVPGSHRALHELVELGVFISNSETGHGSLSVEPFCRVLVCDNGLIVNRPMRVRHVGRRLDGDDGAWMEADTRRLDDAALFLMVRDRVAEALNEVTQRRVAEVIGEAKVEPVPLEDVPVFEMLNGVSAKFELTKAEHDALNDEYVAAQVQSGSAVATRWSVAQALTAVARTQEERDGLNDLSPESRAERRVAMERGGWSILTAPVAQLARLARAARQEGTRPERN